MAINVAFGMMPQLKMRKRMNLSHRRQGKMTLNQIPANTAKMDQTQSL